MSNLVEYYRSRQFTDKALDRYLKMVEQQHWDIGGNRGKLDLYSLATQAFGSQTARSVKYEPFGALYHTVRNWPGSQRGGKWFDPAEAVFDVLVGPGRNFLYGSGVSLANLTYPSDEASRLKELLPSLSFFKEISGYPHMAVSKVLHFANPALFPIWDNEVLWKKVMWRGDGRNAAFRTEYKTFCHKHDFTPTENGAKFLLSYTLWAADYIQQRNDDFMDWFVAWMERNYSDDITKYGMRQALHEFYATAFEFVAIGAAYLELGE